MSDLCIRISLSDQKLLFCKGEDALKRYPVSSSSKGSGCEEKSFKTPTGHHKIHSMIGSKSPINTVFIHRRPTSRIWNHADIQSDLQDFCKRENFSESDLYEEGDPLSSYCSTHTPSDCAARRGLWF